MLLNKDDISELRYSEILFSIENFKLQKISYDVTIWLNSNLCRHNP